MPTQVGAWNACQTRAPFLRAEEREPEKEISHFQPQELAGNTQNTKLEQPKASVAYYKGRWIRLMINALPRLIEQI